MSRKSHLLWNTGASVIAVIVLIGAAGRLRAYWQTPPEQTIAAASTQETPSSPAPTGEHARKEAGKEESGGPLKEIFNWVNFLIIAAGFWYLGKKYLAPYLDARAQSIREDMQRSSQALHEATLRLSVIEAKLQRLDEEIGSLRSAALQEANAERARIEDMSKVDARKIALVAEQEIAAATKVARHDLKVYAAELAVGLAEKKIQASMSPQSEKAIFHSFLEELSNGSRRGNGTS